MHFQKESSLQQVPVSTIKLLVQAVIEFPEVKNRCGEYSKCVVWWCTEDAKASSLKRSAAEGQALAKRKSFSES